MSRNTRLRLARTVALGTLGLGSFGCSEEPVSPVVVHDAGPGVGNLEVVTTTTGVALDPDGYEVLVDGKVPWIIDTNGVLTLNELVAGDHVLELTDVAQNCAVLGDNPRTVIVTANGRTTFAISCEANAGVAIVSGDAQKVKVGKVGKPLVVRVTDRSGTPVENLDVTWGAGAHEVLLVDQRGVVAFENAWSETVTRTDVHGITQMSFIPASFAVATVHAKVSACQDGCGESEVNFSVDARDSGAALRSRSGDSQKAKAGRLGEPFVVQVVDRQGDAVPYAAVHWIIKYGEGTFEAGFDDGGTPLSYTLAHTDADGLAQLSVLPTWFGPVEVEASARVSEGSPTTFTMDATDMGASLTILSGEDLDGKAGEKLAEPFVVQVTDGQGGPVPNVLVDWTVDESWSARTYSGADGVARLLFTPRRLGVTRVHGSLLGLPVRVTFTTTASVLVIHYQPGAYGWPSYFESIPDYGSCDYSSYCWHYVPVGTSVEWVNHLPTARIVSTSAPEAGAPIDSGDLNEGERFQFVAAVAGTWEYMDAGTRAKGALIAY